MEIGPNKLRRGRGGDQHKSVTGLSALWKKLRRAEKMLTALTTTPTNIIDGPDLPSISGFVRREFTTRHGFKNGGKPGRCVTERQEGHVEYTVTLKKDRGGGCECEKGKVEEESAQSIPYIVEVTNPTCFHLQEVLLNSHGLNTSFKNVVWVMCIIYSH